METRLLVGVLSLIATMQTTLPAAQARRSMFVFQNNFWLNLHQFLRGEIYRRSVKAPPGIDPDALTDADRAAWMSALDGYSDIARRDLIADETSRGIANTLAMIDDAARLPDGLLDQRITAALNAAAPIYLARSWPARQRANEAWNAAAQALVDRHESAMATALARTYRTTWPDAPILVDAVGEVGPTRLSPTTGRRALPRTFRPARAARATPATRRWN